MRCKNSNECVFIACGTTVVMLCFRYVFHRTADVTALLIDSLTLFNALLIAMRLPLIVINLLKPTGYVMHQQFNIQQLYALPTPYLCVLHLS